MVDRFPNVAEFLPGGATLNAMRAVQVVLFTCSAQSNSISICSTSVSVLLCISEML